MTSLVADPSGYIPKRTIWMTQDQRTRLARLLSDEVQVDPLLPGCEHVIRVLEELSLVQSRQRISGRLLRNHVSGLRLPHDALPVRMTDDEAIAVLQFDLGDSGLERMLQPGPVKRGWR